MTTRYYTKAEVYTKAQSNSAFQTQAQTDARYYTKAQSDSNYYTKAQVDAKFATSGNLTMGPSSFATASANARVMSTSGCVRNSVANDVLFAGLQLPAGASVRAFSAAIVDNTANSSTLLLVRQTADTTPVKTTLGTITSINAGGTPTVSYVTLPSPVLVTPSGWWGLEWSTADASDAALLCGATVTYTIPAGSTIG